jgi:PAS domain S-box-containing protein
MKQEDYNNRPVRWPEMLRLRLAWIEDVSKSFVRKSRIHRYGFSLIVSVLFVTLKVVFPEVTGTMPYLPFITSALFCAWIAGIGPGMVSIAVSVLGQIYFFGESPLELSLESVGANDSAGLLGFIAIAMVMNWLLWARRFSRQRAEAAVSEAREQSVRTNAIMQSALDSIIVMDEAGKVREFNPAAEQMFGYTRAEAVGQEMADLIIPPEFRELHRQGLAKFLATGVGPLLGRRIEIEALRRDGSRFAVELAIAPSRLESGYFFTGYIRDIEQRKRTEEELKSSQERLQLAQRAGNIGTFDWNLKSGQVAWSEELERLFELEPGELGGSIEDWFDMVHPEDRRAAQKAARAAIENHTQLNTEYRVCLKDGREKWIAVRAQVYYDETGHPIRMVGINRNVTRRKQTEKALNFLTEASRILSSSLNYETTLNNIVKLIVPHFADWCAIDLLDDQGQVKRVMQSHSERINEQAARRFEMHYDPSTETDSAKIEVLRTGKPTLYEELDNEALTRLSDDPQRVEMLRELNFSSLMVVPVEILGWAAGTITLAVVGPNRKYGKDDLLLAQGFAERAATAIDNAWLYRETKAARDELEKKVKERTAELEEAEKEYHGIFNNAVEGIYRTSPQGELLLANPAAAQICGYASPEQLIESLNKIGRPPYVDQKRREEFIELMRENDGVIDFESQIYRADGKVIWISEKARAVRDEQANILYFEGTIEDITARKTAEAEMAKLASIVESADDAIISKTLDGVITSWNKGAQQIYGYKESEVVGKSIGILIPQEKTDELPTILRKLRQGERIQYYETERVRKDGRRIMVSLTISPVKDDTGKVIGVSTIARDITNAKNAEDERLRLANYLQLLLTSVGEGIFAVDEHGVCTLMNPAGARMLGYEPEEVVGRDIHTLIHHTRPSGAPYKREECPVLQAFNTGQGCTVDDEIFWRKDGAGVAVRYSAQPVRQGERVTGAVATFEDITERKKLERMKIDFVSLVSHQLKTPLAIIKGYTDNMLLGIAGDLSSKQQQYLQEMREIVAKYYYLIADLLNVSRIERGVISVNLEPVALREIADVVYNNHEEGVARKGLELKMILPEEDIVVMADKNKMAEAVSNVVDNAIKFTTKGAITMHLRAEEDNGILEVRDSGAGMDEATIQKLFKKDQIFSGSPTPEGGSGLGLYIAKEFMSYQHGEIKVTSRAGQGSKFTFKVPLVKVKTRV